MIGERLHPSQITPTCFGGSNFIGATSSATNLTKTRRTCSRDA